MLLFTQATTPYPPAVPLPYTGDHTPFALVGGIMAVALVVIIIALIAMRKK